MAAPGGAFGGLDAAATYLGVTQDQLRTDLQGGKSLADVAKAQGKTVDGLVTAMTDATKKNLDAAVTAGRLTQSQADTIESDLNQRITDQVNGTFPGRPGGDDGDGGYGFHRFGPQNRLGPTQSGTFGSQTA